MAAAPDTRFVIVNQVSDSFPDALTGVLEGDTGRVDLPRARDQWWNFVNAIRSFCGADVVPLFINQAHGDGRYIEDAFRFIPLPSGELLMVEMPFGHNGRKAERMAAVEAARMVLDARGVPLSHSIVPPPDLLGDGGDTYYSRALRKFYIGISSRSTLAFAEYLEAQLREYGIELVRVAINGKCCLHLITGSSLLDPYTVAVHRPSIGREGIGILAASGLEIIEIDNDEPNGANYFAANGKLIGDAFGSPKSFRIVSERYEVESVRYDQSGIKNGSFTCDTAIVPLM